MTTIIVDVWDGEDSQEHVARKLRNIEDALDIAKRELLAGFLVNLRTAEPELAFEPDFDERVLA
jgi:hypothetical protein